MLKEFPKDNLTDLMTHISLATRDQLAYFFRDVLTGNAADLMIENEIRYHTLIESRRGDYLQRHLAPLIKSETAYRFIKAFWVIADFGSETIEYVVEGEYPVQYLFLTTEAVYDITVIPNLPTAELAYENRRANVVRDCPDAIIHIAVIDDPDMIPMLRKYGFDFFYSVDTSAGEVTAVGEE